MTIHEKCSVCYSENPSKIHHNKIEKSIIEGELHFFFSVDMREFLKNSDKGDREISKQEFEKLQGSKQFAKALKKMKSALRENEKAKEIHINGFNNGVFGGSLVKTWLNFPTFEIQDDEGVWLLRCSWLGLFEVHLIKVLRNKDKYNFVKVIEKILEYRTKYDDGTLKNEEIDKTDIWYKVFEKINEFCRNILKFEYDNIDFRAIPLNNHISFTQRQRYGIVVAKEIICSECEKRLPAEILGKNSLLTSLLYSSLISDLPVETSDNTSKQIKIPELVVENVKNLSTWSNEICAFGPERGFIYYDPKIRVEEHEDSYDYDDYWKYILRGVQHTVTVRAEMQSLQTQIKKLTDKLPALLAEIDKQIEIEKANSEIPELSNKINRYLVNSSNSEDDMALSLSNILQIMPTISTICIPTIAFKANFAVDKFRYLNEQCFDFPAVLTALRRDTRDVSSFLEFSKSYQLQLTVESRREQERKRQEQERERQRLEDERNKNEAERNRIANKRLLQQKENEKARLEQEKEINSKREDFALLVAIAAIFFIAPTAIKDGAVFLSVILFDQEHIPRPIFILSVLFFFLIILFLYLYRRKQEENRQTVLGLDKDKSKKETNQKD